MTVRPKGLRQGLLLSSSLARGNIEVFFPPRLRQDHPEPSKVPGRRSQASWEECACGACEGLSYVGTRGGGEGGQTLTVKGDDVERSSFL